MSDGTSKRTIAGRCPGPWRRFLALAAGVGLAATVAALTSCTTQGEGIQTKERLLVTVNLVESGPPPSPEEPRPANIGDTYEAWAFTVTSLDAEGQQDTSFNGYVRIDVEPGSVRTIETADPGLSDGRNIRLVNGFAEGTAYATAMFGPTRLWAKDIGYVPAPDGVVPTCANGVDDDGDVMVDYPQDDGCAFADDMSEEGARYIAAVSQPVYYALPTIADLQGRGAKTPYGAVAMQIDTDVPHTVVVTRVSSNGFFVTDLADMYQPADGSGGYNHLFAYNFNTPEGMQVCDEVTFLSGTASEFFGFTEISFPSFEVNYLNADGVPFGPPECQVPEPTLIDPTVISPTDPVEMEKLESGLVRLEGFHIGAKFGPELAVNNSFDTNRSNCDLNQDGVIDYLNELEGKCSDACTEDPECSEWTNYTSWGSYKMSSGIHMIRVSTATAFGFDPLAHKGEEIRSLTGTLRNFSGGDLNWTVETRCVDDLICDYDDCPQPSKWDEAPDDPARYCELCTGCLADYGVPCEQDCTEQPCGWRCPVRTQVDSRCACVQRRTEVDNDAATY
ncbi:MAG: hypothetical protein JRI23_20220 [Deltaproteobacteria bacterium]|jgi:hypothetical protein|nr:hypothetical protein [Deltaproteobacteria bacterium]MBW2534212.1 hypothetical protein [Deltaproteobacteria bacterium]